jgi:hypothetical protein
MLELFFLENFYTICMIVLYAMGMWVVDELMCVSEYASKLEAKIDDHPWPEGKRPFSIQMIDLATVIFWPITVLLMLAVSTWENFYGD